MAFWDRNQVDTTEEDEEMDEAQPLRNESTAPVNHLSGVLESIEVGANDEGTGERDAAKTPLQNENNDDNTGPEEAAESTEGVHTPAVRATPPLPTINTTPPPYDSLMAVSTVAATSYIWENVDWFQVGPPQAPWTNIYRLILGSVERQV